MAEAIASAGGEPESASAVPRRLRQGPAALRAELTRLRGGRFRRVLLVVDQFEEVVTLAGEPTKADLATARDWIDQHSQGPSCGYAA